MNASTTRRHLARSLSFLAIVGLLVLVTVPVHAASTHKVVVFLQGLGSSLSQSQIAAMRNCSVPVQGDPFSKLKTQLLKNGTYQCSDFLQFSYTGGFTDGQGSWQPAPYDCIAAGAQSLASNAKLLAVMLSDYENAHSGVQIRYELVGHSLGGLTAFDASALAGPAFSANAIDSIITIDSPLNHISAANLQAQRASLPGYTVPHPAPACSSTNAAHAYNFTWSPAIIAVSDVTDAQSKQSYIADRQAVVTAGQGQQIRYMTTGNSSDCAYDETLCNVPGTWLDDRYSMTVANANLSTTFNEGTHGCVATSFVADCSADTHLAALLDGKTAVPAMIAFMT